MFELMLTVNLYFLKMQFALDAAQQQFIDLKNVATCECILVFVYVCLDLVMVGLWMEEEAMEEAGDVAHSTDGPVIGK